MIESRKSKKVLSMLLAFSFVVNIIGTLTAPASASNTRTFSIDWTIAAGGTSTGATKIYLDSGDLLNISLTFTPLGTFTPIPKDVYIGVVDAGGANFLSPLSMGNSGNSTSDAKWRVIDRASVYKFRMRNNLGVPVRVTGTFTYTKSVTNIYSNEGGLGNRTVTIGLQNTSTVTLSSNATWQSVINDARTAWNHSGADTNITTTTSGPNQHVLKVGSFDDIFDGATTKYPLGKNVAATASMIEINTTGNNNLGATGGDSTAVAKRNRLRRAIVVHELGHLLWLGDKPKTNASSIMKYDDVKNYDLPYTPSLFDFFNVRFKYD